MKMPKSEHAHGRLFNSSPFSWRHARTSIFLKFQVPEVVQLKLSMFSRKGAQPAYQRHLLGKTNERCLSFAQDETRLRICSDRALVREHFTRKGDNTILASLLPPLPILHYLYTTAINHQYIPYPISYQAWYLATGLTHYKQVADMDMSSTAMSMTPSTILSAMSTMSDSSPSTTPTTMSMVNMASATTSAAMTSSTAGMSMDMGTSSCRIAMTWNWYTIDACK
jgi:hypothetical protein